LSDEKAEIVLFREIECERVEIECFPRWREDVAASLRLALA
jgi:hypothetical protein